MKREDFILPVVIIKTQEKKLLSMQKLIRMLETNTSKEILKILNDTEYSFSMLGVDSDQMYEDILFNETKRIYTFARELAQKEQKIVDILALKYEYQNLKLNLKKDFSNSDLKRYIFDTNLSDKTKLISNFNKVKLEKDLKKATIILDKMYLEHIAELAKELKFDIFKKYSLIMIDKYNICSFLRLKEENQNIDYVENIFVDGGSISKIDLIKMYENNNYISTFKKVYNDKIWDNLNISEVEKMLDNQIIKLAIEYKNVTMGPEPIFTYIIAKEFEIKALRLIISAKINSIDTNLIKARMRGTYV